MLTSQLLMPGEHFFSLEGQVGPLDVALTVPNVVNSRYFAILGHPHSLQGGTMNNKVVTTLARAFKDLNIPSLRFNFRGVGDSSGVYDHGVGESEDMLLLANEWLKERPKTELLLAGFSFGSYVAYRAAAKCRPALLISIAPPVHHYDFKEFSPAPAPWVIVHGESDEVVPLDQVETFAKQASPEIPLKRFPETGHFFHGKLIDLRQAIIEMVESNVLTS